VSRCVLCFAGYIFESQLVNLLLGLFPQAPYRNVALQCLTEVCMRFLARSCQLFMLHTTHTSVACTHPVTHYIGAFVLSHGTFLGLLSFTVQQRRAYDATLPRDRKLASEHKGREQQASHSIQRLLSSVAEPSLLLCQDLPTGGLTICRCCCRLDR